MPSYEENDPRDLHTEAVYVRLRRPKTVRKYPRFSSRSEYISDVAQNQSPADNQPDEEPPEPIY